MLVEPTHPNLSIRRQCELLGLNRSTFYRQPADETALNLKLMKLIDREYTRAPFYGYRKMTVRLNSQHDYQVNHKRVARLMQKMGLQAVFPRPRTSIPAPQHKSIRICCEDWRLRTRTRFGQPISPTSRCRMDLCIWWQLWTGTAAS